MEVDALPVIRGIGELSPIRRLQRVLLLAMPLCMATSCSIVDPDRAGAIPEAAAWKSRAEARAMSGDQTAEIRAAYIEARAAIDGWVAGLQTKIGQIEPVPFLQVKLRPEDIPVDVRTRVDAYFFRAGGRGPIIALTVGKWVYDIAAEARHRAAMDLRDRLNDLKWREWEKVAPPATPGGRP